MLFIDLKPIFFLKGIDRPVPLLMKAGISRHSAADLIDGKTRALRLDHLEILCDVLNCLPQDILSFRSGAGKTYPANHPLLSLIKEKITGNMHQTVATMPLADLKALTKEITKKKTE